MTQFAREEIQSSQICGAGIIEAINRAGCSQYNREAGAWLLFAFLHLEESPIVCWLSDVSRSAASNARDELFPENGRQISTSAGWICWPSTLLHTEFRFYVHNCLLPPLAVVLLFWFYFSLSYLCLTDILIEIYDFITTPDRLSAQYHFFSLSSCKEALLLLLSSQNLPAAHCSY